MIYTLSKSWRPAIAMIELIFAIVVMGIVMMSAPMLLNQARTSTYVGLQQESIAAIASQTGMIFTYHWDEEDTNISKGSPILRVTNGDPELDEVIPVGTAGTGLRIGMPNSSSRNFRINIGGRLDATVGLGTDANESSIDDFDDIDDFNGEVVTLTAVGGSPNNTGDYVDRNILMTATVSYRNDIQNYTQQNITYTMPPATAAATTNIKYFTLNLITTTTATELDKNITLQAFSCNIGSYRHQERTY